MENYTHTARQTDRWMEGELDRQMAGHMHVYLDGPAG